MPDLDSFKKDLLDTTSPEHDKALRFAKDKIDLSRKEMAKHYTRWDEHDRIFRAWRWKDKEDRAAYDKDEPQKMIVPLTFSQVMTFVSFAVSTLTQNDRFFELEPTGTEASPLKEPIEKILERDCKKNAWTSFLVQFFLDIGRFGLGAAEVCYKEESRFIRLPQQNTIPGAFGTQTSESTNVFQSIPTFVGNRVYPISPYHFYPDVRVPITRFQEGEFCGSEEMFSISALKSDTSGALFNLDKIPKMTEKEFNTRYSTTRLGSNFEMRENPNMGSDGGENPDNMVKAGSVIVSKVVCDIVPKDFKAEGDKPAFGTEAFPVRYIIWYANDKTVIRFEEATFLHGQFPYVCAQFIPDQHMILNQSLAEVCSHINTLVTWLINAHTASQKNAFESKWVVDPAGIEMKSLESRSPYIFLKKNASNMGVDRFIKQFQTTDVTQAAMGDVAALKDLLEGSTGFTGMMQGQYSSGRRDATQSRVVTQGATTRGKVTVSSIWESAFVPLAKQLTTNNRQEMDFETFCRILGPQPGDNGTMPDPEKLPSAELFQLFSADPITIATDEQFFVFDGSLPSEKAFLAQSLQEIFMALLQNPQVSQIMGYGPAQLRSIFEEMYELRGVTAPYLPPPQPMQPAAQPGQQPGEPPGPSLAMPVPTAPQPFLNPSALPSPA